MGEMTLWFSELEESSRELKQQDSVCLHCSSSPPRTASVLLRSRQSRSSSLTGLLLNRHLPGLFLLLFLFLLFYFYTMLKEEKQRSSSSSKRAHIIETIHHCLLGARGTVAPRIISSGSSSPGLSPFTPPALPGASTPPSHFPAWKGIY